MRITTFVGSVLFVLAVGHSASAQVAAPVSTPATAPTAPPEEAAAQSSAEAPNVVAPPTVPQPPVVVARPFPVASPTAARESFDESEGVEGYADPEPPIGLAGRIALTATLDVSWFLDTAHDAFSTESSVPAGGLAASLTLFELSPGWLLDLGLGWRFEASEASVLQTVTAAYEANTTYVDAALRFELTPWFVPRARVSAGLQYLSASLTPNDGTAPLDGDAFSFVTSVGVGVELLGRLSEGLTSRESRTAALTFSLVVEGGLMLGSSSSLTVAPRELDDEEAAADLIPVVGTNIGTLGGIAPYLRIAGVIRF